MNSTDPIARVRQLLDDTGARYIDRQRIEEALNGAAESSASRRTGYAETLEQQSARLQDRIDELEEAAEQYLRAEIRLHTLGSDADPDTWAEAMQKALCAQRKLKAALDGAEDGHDG